MTGAALALVLSAAVIHATWNAMAKGARDPMAMLWWAGVLSSLVLAPPSLYVLARDGFSPRALPFVAATVILHSMYFLSLGKAYQTGDFSVVYPMARGMGVALVPMGAYYFFDERLSRLGVLGIALIGLGIFVLHWRRGAWSEDALLRPGTGWAIATGLCIASYSLVDKVGVSHINPLPYLWAMMLGSCVSLLPAVRARPGSMAREWRENRLAVLLSGVLSPGGYLLVLFAFRLSKAGYVVAGREVSIVISALIGSILFKEGRLPQRLLGAAVVAFGVVCVALAR
ncbi:MAG TPA: DMT family transporter [Methylomirabilota bacterium]|nr:DMT family transporter [Methylomirabilota bacterium]